MQNKAISLISILAMNAIAPSVQAMEAVQQTSVSTVGSVAKSTDEVYAKSSVMIENLTDSIIKSVKADKELLNANPKKVSALVQERVEPITDFNVMSQRMLARYWRQMTPEQQEAFKAEFKLLLIKTYSGAIKQIKDQSIKILPNRSMGDEEPVIKTQIISASGGEPIDLSFKIKRENQKIIDLSVAGIWLVDSYKSQFSPILSNGGPDALLKMLKEKNDSFKKELQK